MVTYLNFNNHRKLLFTDKDVLPHEPGAGSTSFKQQQHHSVGTQQSDAVQETDIPSESESKLASCCHGEMNSSVMHKIKQLDIIDQTDTANSITESSHGVVHTDNSTDECINVNGATSAVPITAHHSPTKAMHCTS